MREIKFRAWMPKEQKWYKGGAVQLTAMIGKSFGLSEANGRIIELQQYTGLKDKNGVEIYEGDILSKKYQVGVVRSFLPTRPTYVIFTPRAGYVEGDWHGTHNDLDGRPGAFGFCGDFEVIGNIYETPELLEKAS